MKFARKVTMMAVPVVIALTSMTLTACGGSDGGGPAKAESTGDVAKLIDDNPHPVSDLEQGGTLRYPIQSMGPNFNIYTNAGNSAETSTMLSAFDNAGCWNQKADGTPILNRDYCTGAKQAFVNGKQVLTYDINTKAHYNDGTPIDYKVFQATNRIYNDPKADIVSRAGYDQIESVKQGKNAHQVVVTMQKTYEPWQNLFSGLINPNLAKNAQTFSNALVNKLQPGWESGPFKIEKLNMTDRYLILVPNDQWWGQKPKLAHIVFKQYDTSATIPAFRNDEIDIVNASTLDRYRQVENAPDSDIRRGQNLSVYGLQINAKRGLMSDESLRKAIYMGVDRKTLQKIRFKGLNWTEKIPNSWLMIPFMKGYEDNISVTYDPNAAKKMLDAAGWKMEGDYRVKNGKTAEFKLTDFGGTPTLEAVDVAVQSQMKAIGIKVDLDLRPGNDFNSVMASRSYEVLNAGYGITPDPTDAVMQLYGTNPSNPSGLGSKQFDVQAQKLPEIVNDSQRIAAVNALEKKAQTEFPMLPLYNGPAISGYRKGLANLGPVLFGTINWSAVGWVKGSQHS